MAAVAPINPTIGSCTSTNDETGLVQLESSAVREVIADLRKTPKEISSVWLYDEIGSELFDAICEQPEYYPTRTELQIMERHAHAMAERIGADAALIEFGSGTSLKTRLLLDRLTEPRAYVPVDVASVHLLDAAGAIARDYPSLAVLPLCADFTKPLELPSKVIAAQRPVVYFPGSTIGNFDPSVARRLLDSIRELIGDGGALLVGVDLKKDAVALEKAYQDAAGFTAQFNFNCLRHLNRELNANFVIDNFAHQVLWVEEASRIEMRLISRCDQLVNVGQHRIRFVRGEYIRTIASYKYTLDTFAVLADSAGFGVREVWTDVDKQFSVQLLETNKAS